MQSQLRLRDEKLENKVFVGQHESYLSGSWTIKSRWWCYKHHFHSLLDSVGMATSIPLTQDTNYYKYQYIVTDINHDTFYLVNLFAVFAQFSDDCLIKRRRLALVVIIIVVRLIIKRNGFWKIYIYIFFRNTSCWMTLM